VLLFDASVHSGGTMLKALRDIEKHGATGVCTYTLVLKRGSQFIPGLWGVMINDHDRAYFQMDMAPNNRLTTHLNEKHPYTHLRQLGEADVRKSPVVTEVASLDRHTWGDRYYDMRESGDGNCTYLLETSNAIVGYVTVHFADHVLYVDEVAVDVRHRKHGYGGVLMRFADTLTRQQDCWSVRLNAIRDRVEWYQGFGYKVLAGRNPVHVETEEYVPMEKRLVHHVPPMDD
jgi:GNAT superfamily N-acetyltransferase